MCSARTPDLVWVNIKSRTYATHPASLEELRERVVCESAQISPEILKIVQSRIQQNFYHCMVNGEHLQYLVVIFT